MVDDPPPTVKSGLFTKLLLFLAGVDEQTLRDCPPGDWDCVRAVGLIMVCTFLYQSGLFALVAHLLFATPGQIRPDLVIASLFIASFIMCLDSFAVMRPSWIQSGYEELKRGGLDISGGALARIKNTAFLPIRLGLSLGIAQLTGIFVSLLVFGGDISAHMQKSFLDVNAHLIPAATALVDGVIQRATEAVTGQAAQVAALSGQVTALRQSEVEDPHIQQAEQEVAQLIARKAKADEDVQSAERFAASEAGGVKGAGNSGQPGYGVRYKAAMEQVANAKSHAQALANELNAARARLDSLRKQTTPANDATMQRAHDQLPAFERALEADSAKLSSLKAELSGLTNGRESAIRKAVENAPDHVDYNGGFLAQIAVLEHIAQEDTKIAAIILLIGITSFGLELAAVLSKVTSYVPTTYAALLAKHAYMSSVRIVDDITAELIAIDGKAAKPAEAAPQDTPVDDRQPFGQEPESAPGSTEPAPQPPKRRRGRPRKHPVQESSEKPVTKQVTNGKQADEDKG